MRIGFWAGALAIALSALPALADDKPLPFTEAQAGKGAIVFAAQCAACHGATLDGGPGGPPLKGGAFRIRFQAQPGDGLFAFVRDKMPPGGAGSLTASEYADVVAFILKSNGGKAGKTPLPAEAKDLASFSLVATLPPMAAAPLKMHPIPQGVAPDQIETDAAQRRAARLAKITPVTDETLRNPPESDWINPRRTYDSHGFSPLKQIDRGNVAKLQMAWAWELSPSQNEITPLIHDGIMFITSNGRVQALDAASGDLLWQYTHPTPVGIVRNLGIAGENIIFPAETDVVALNMRTGKVVWQTAVVPPGYGVRMGAGPLIVKGIVLQGVGMCVGPMPGGCYIVGLDAKTGQELWRFYGIARPGQPGGNTWNKAPVDERFGGSIWTAGSYDPDLDLAYFGIGQTYKFSTLLDNYDGTPGGNDGLYTDSTVAIRPATGELVWYYQHMNRDVWDLDWAFERTVATIKIDGKPRKTVTTAGKLNIFDTVDAATGAYLFSYDVGLQDLVQSIDPKTGRKIINPKFDPPPPNVPIRKCPSTLGGRDWPATSYNTATGILFVPENETCHEHTWLPGSNFQLNDHLMRRFNSDGMVGRVEAIDLASRKTLWVQRRRAPQTMAILGTAGGIIFEGDYDRWFRALDQRTGKVLWQTQLNATPSSVPVTYSVDGVQYIAVVAGGGGSLSGTLGAALTPEIPVPASGTTLWVFRLPAGK